MNGVSKRCDSTTWNMSPAAMYSLALSTMAVYSSGVVLELRLADRRSIGASGHAMIERPVERFDDLERRSMARA